MAAWAFLTTLAAKWGRSASLECCDLSQEIKKWKSRQNILEETKPGLVLGASSCVLGMTQAHQQLLRDRNYLWKNSPFIWKFYGNERVPVQESRWNRNARRRSTTGLGLRSLRLPPCNGEEWIQEPLLPRWEKVAWKGASSSVNGCPPGQRKFSF